MLDSVTPDVLIACHEALAPELAVMAYGTLDEVLAIAEVPYSRLRRRR